MVVFFIAIIVITVVAVSGIELLGCAMTIFNELIGYAEMTFTAKLGTGLVEIAIMVVIMSSVTMLLCQKFAELMTKNQ